MNSRQQSREYVYSSDQQRQRIKQNLNLQQTQDYRHSLAASTHSQSESTIFQCDSPCSPNMREFKKRYDTYLNWPNHIKATRTELATAGFICLGVRDRVKCFYCNGGLQNWLRDEDPWFEHAKWYPNCDYLLRCKGIGYVQNVAEKFPNINRPSLLNPIPRNPLPNRLSSKSSQSQYQHNSYAPPMVMADTLEHNVSSLAPAKILEDKVEAEMRSEYVEVALGLGFEESIVRNIVKRKLQMTDTRYTSSSSIVNDILIEEEKNNATPHSEQSYTFAIQERMDVDSVDCNVPTTSTVRAAGSVLMENLLPNALNSVSVKVPPTRKDQEVAQRTPYYSDSSDNTKEKLRTLREQQTCRVCLDHEMDCVILPCNHICCCTECVRALRTCPICRTKISKVIKIYRQ